MLATSEGNSFCKKAKKMMTAMPRSSRPRVKKSQDELMKFADQRAD